MHFILKLQKSLYPAFKSRPHQQQCRSRIVECYKSKDSFDKVGRCFDIVAVFGNNVAAVGISVERSFVLSKKSKQTEHVQFLSTMSKGQNFTKNMFELLPFLATKLNVASMKSNVVSTLLPVASTFLLVWTGLYTHIAVEVSL